MKKIYPQTIGGKLWSAIQITTASALCAVVDRLLSPGALYKGFVTHQTFGLKEILENRFGRYYR